MMTTDALRSVINLAHTSGAHVLCVYHTRKGPSYGDPFESILGSQGIWASFDAGMIYSKGSGLGECDRVLTIDGRRHVERRSLIVRLDDSSGGLYSLGSYTEVRSGVVLTFLENAGPASIDEIVEETGLGRGTVQRYLSFLDTVGKAEQIGEGKKGDPYRWEATTASTTFTSEEGGADLSDLTEDGDADGR